MTSPTYRRTRGSYIRQYLLYRRLRKTKLVRSLFRKWLIVLLIPVIVIIAAAALLSTAVIFLAGVSDRQSATLSVSARPRIGLSLTAAQEAGCGALAGYMNYDLDAVRAWCASEGNVGNPGQPANNFLFLSCGVPEEDGCVTLNGRKWATFASVDIGAIAMWNNLARGPKLYGGILAASGTDPITEILAIAESPWDEGHYGNPPGTNLIGAYDSLRGIRVSCPGNRVCAE